MNRQFWRIGKEELHAISKMFESGFTGENRLKLEDEFSKRLGIKYAVSVNSGNSAIHCCLGAIGVGPGDEVIVPPLTFISPAMTVLYTGAVPIFTDINPDTFTIDPKEIERKITRKTKAIIPVSVYGLCADMDPIMKIAKRYKLYVIEDDAESMLAEYKGRLAGTIADMSIFSFERSKHLTTGDGGMIVTDDKELALKARKFSNLGYTTLSARQSESKITKDDVQHPDFKRHDSIGYNYRMPEICAAVARVQLKKADMFIKKRCKIARLYEKAIADSKLITPQKTPKRYKNTYWTYAMLLDTSKVKWEEFRTRFQANGGDRFYAAWKLNYLEPVFENLSFLCPIAEKIQPRIIQLKTNYENLEYAKNQAKILKKTITEFE
ncbi:MAG: DegT/DnrJ/EryC1/StrS family aminotransferase [Elusimicrobiota bacterium]